MTSRPKRVRISVTRARRYSTYIYPVSAALCCSLVLVLLSSIVMLTKKFGNEEHPNRGGRVPQTVRALELLGKERGLEPGLLPWVFRRSSLLLWRS